VIDQSGGPVRPRAGRRVAALLAAVLLAVLPAPVAAAPEGARAFAASDATTRLLVTFDAPVTVAQVAGADDVATPLGEVGDRPSAVQVLEFGSAQAAEAAAARLARRPDVVTVEPDHVVRLVADPPPRPDAGVPGPYGWWLRNDGRSVDGVAGRRGVDVGAQQSWPRTTGRGVVVAVIDTGVDTDHPAVRDRLWNNPGEAVTGRDDDGNGFVDDVHGWNFAADSPQLFDPASRDEHGTHIAGLIAGARTATTPGGVAPDARLMILKFIDGDVGFVSDAIAAIRYAVANGADVINASWASADPSMALRTVLAEVPVPVVVAAGNRGQPLEREPSYPAAWGLANLTSVAAVDHTGVVPPFSSTSRQLVDVAAPGVGLVGPYPGGAYAAASGTSQATAQVTGVLALALERHPGLTGRQAAAALRVTVRPLAGADPTRSGGIVRAPALLDHLGTPVRACPTPVAVVFVDVPAVSTHHDAIGCLTRLGVTRGVTADEYGSASGLTRGQIASLVYRVLAPADLVPAPPRTGRFVDVPRSSTHRDAIEALAAAGVLRGTTATTFAPDQVVTRAQLAAITVRAAELLAGGDIRAAAPPFPDAGGHALEAELRKAAGVRIVLGRPDGTFVPDLAVRRDQAASMLTRLLDRFVQYGLIEPV
jgi:subtilisin family serine protease